MLVGEVLQFEIRIRPHIEAVPGTHVVRFFFDLGDHPTLEAVNKALANRVVLHKRSGARFEADDLSL